MNYFVIVLSVLLSIGGLAFVFLNFRGSVKAKVTADLTKEERTSVYPANHFKNDINRFGRWSVTFLNGTKVVRMGFLAGSLNDHKHSFSPVNTYQEII